MYFREYSLECQHLVIDMLLFFHIEMYHCGLGYIEHHLATTSAFHLETNILSSLCREYEYRLAGGHNYLQFYCPFRPTSVR